MTRLGRSPLRGGDGEAPRVARAIGRLAGGGSGRRIKLPGFKMNKDGQLVRDASRWDVSTRLKRQGQTRVKYGKR